MSKITHLKLENFTAFESLDQEFSDGVNVIIGGNGTGKTHVLKVLYAAAAITSGEDKDKTYGAKLRGVFNPYEGRVGRLARRQSTSVRSKITITRKDGGKLSAEFSNHTSKPEDMKITGESNWKKEELGSAYIPVKEMLAHAPGFLATAARREIAFEEVYIDIIKHAYLPRLTGPTDSKRDKLLKALQKAIDGKVVAKGEFFFLKNSQGDLEFTLLAEGMRKLALIWLLIQNGTLLAGSILFWDEPEANLNPAFMGQVVAMILELQRLGVQVFLTTHNYVLLKEFDLQKQKDDKIRFISFARDDKDKCLASSTEKYLDISPNLISDAFTDLYKRDVARAFNRRT